jgi:hypothetical protein
MSASYISRDQKQVSPPEHAHPFWIPNMLTLFPSISMRPRSWINSPSSSSVPVGSAPPGSDSPHTSYLTSPPLRARPLTHPLGHHGATARCRIHLAVLGLPKSSFCPCWAWWQQWSPRGGLRRGGSPNTTSEMRNSKCLRPAWERVPQFTQGRKESSWKEETGQGGGRGGSLRSLLHKGNPCRPSD